MKKLAFVLAFLLLCGTMAIDTVMVATTVNYPDAIVAASASVKEGIPIVFTGRNRVSRDFLRRLGELNVSKVILLGGTAVLSQEVEQGLTDDGFEVVRLAGETRYDTAVEISKYFWPQGSSKVVLAYDTTLIPVREDNSPGLAASRIVAAKNQAPLILVPAEDMPANVAAELERLSPNETIVTGTKIGERVRRQLNNPRDEDDADSDVEKKLAVIAAVLNYRHVVEASVEPSENAAAYLVRSEDDIPDVISKVRDFERIKVVGRPSLAKAVEAALTEENITFEERGAQLESKLNELRERAEEWSQLRERMQQAAQEKVRLRTRDCAGSGGLCVEFYEDCSGSQFEAIYYTCTLQNQKCCMGKAEGVCEGVDDCLAFDPVCGNETTFDNACEACDAGILTFTRGECQSCSRLKTCGSDGVLYPTNCLPEGVEKKPRYECACEQREKAYCTAKANACRAKFKRVNLICSDERNEICCAPEE